MNTSASDPWKTATSLQDLASATVDFLEGKLQNSPSHGGPAADETDGLIRALVKMNRHGFITLGSQPGRKVDVSSRSAQRAYVEGLCDSETAYILEVGLLLTDLVTVRVDPGDEAYSSIPVTIDDLEPFTFVGRWGTDALEHYRNGNASLDAALGSASYIQIFDPVWGRDEILWSHVNEVLESLGSTN